MGLDTSHDCWHGAYSAFHRWRHAIANAIGLRLDHMQGFADGSALPVGSALEEIRREMAEAREDEIAGRHTVAAHTRKRVFDKHRVVPWDALPPDPLFVLLHHSDCDGEIAVEHLLPLAERLEEIAPILEEIDQRSPPGGHLSLGNAGAARRFAAGCRRAAEANEPVDFH
jgi:hypothetical protein